MRLLPHALVVASAPLGLLVALLAPEIDLSFYDARLALREDRGWPPDLVMVEVDETAVASLGGWPLPGTSLARLVETLRAQGASTIVIDAFLGTVGGAAEEAALARVADEQLVTAVIFDPAHGRAPSNAELGVAMLEAECASAPRVPRTRLAFPVAPLASRAMLGHAGFRDRGSLRTSPPLVRIEGEAGTLPSQGLAAVLVHRGIAREHVTATASSLALPRRRMELSHGEIRLDLVPGGAAPRSVDAVDVLGNRVAAGSLEGALAVVHFTGPGDRHASPLGRDTPGGLLLAASIRTLDGGRSPRVPSAAPQCLALAAAAALLLRLPRRSLRVSGLVTLEAAWIVASIALVPLADVLLPLVAPLTTMSVCLGALVAHRAPPR